MKKIYNTIKRNYNTSPFGTLLIMILAAPLIIITKTVEYFDNKKRKNVFLDFTIIFLNLIWIVYLFNHLLSGIIKLLGLIFSI